MVNQTTDVLFFIIRKIWLILTSIVMGVCMYGCMRVCHKAKERENPSPYKSLIKCFCHHDAVLSRECKDKK